MLKKTLIFLVLFFVASVAGAISIQVTWNANTESDLAGYKLYYGTQTGVYPYVIDVGLSTSHVIPNVLEKTSYFVAVTAYNTSGMESDKSDEASCAVPAQVPNQPAAPLLVAGEKQITVNWASVATAATYKIYCGLSSGQYGAPITVTGTSYTITGLADFTTYYVSISAVDDGGDESVKSSEVSVRTKAVKPAKPDKPKLSIWEQFVYFLKRLFNVS